MRVFEFVIALFDVDLSAYTAGFSRVSPTLHGRSPGAGSTLAAAERRLPTVRWP